jgi:hypothetical protein
MLLYQRQRWHCKACGASGLVLCRVDDTLKMRQWRLEESHAAAIREALDGPRSGRRRCPVPELALGAVAPCGKA